MFAYFQIKGFSERCPDLKGIKTSKPANMTHCASSERFPDLKGIKTWFFAVFHAALASERCPDLKGIKTYRNRRKHVRVAFLNVALI